MEDAVCTSLATTCCGSAALWLRVGSERLLCSSKLCYFSVKSRPSPQITGKRVCQQRAAVMCLHRVLWGCRINPKETWCGHALLSPGFHKMAITIFWKGTKGAGAEACLQKDALLSDESEIWPGCPICISSRCLELKEKRGIQAQWFLESASS